MHWCCLSKIRAVVLTLLFFELPYPKKSLNPPLTPTSLNILSFPVLVFEKARSTGIILSYVTNVWLSSLRDSVECYVVTLGISKALIRRGTGIWVPLLRLSFLSLFSHIRIFLWSVHFCNWRWNNLSFPNQQRYSLRLCLISYCLSSFHQRYSYVNKLSNSLVSWWINSAAFLHFFQIGSPFLSYILSGRYYLFHKLRFG